MTHHELKIAPKHFNDIIMNNKSFEIREAIDKYFSVGDTVILKEWISAAPVDCNPFHKGNFTGRQLNIEIIFVTTYAQQKGYVVFGFNVLPESIY